MTENSDYKYCVSVDFDVTDPRDQNEIENNAENLAPLHLVDTDTSAQNNHQEANDDRYETHATFYLENELDNYDKKEKPSDQETLFLSELGSPEQNPTIDDVQETNVTEETNGSHENEGVPQFQVVYSDEERYSDDELPDSLSPCRDGQRRESKWSATILFVASEVQLIIDLAEFCPPEGFLTEPQKVGFFIVSYNGWFEIFFFFFKTII